MCTTVLEKIVVVIGAKPRATKVGIKVQEWPLTSVEPLTLLWQSLGLQHTCYHEYIITQRACARGKVIGSVVVVVIVVVSTKITKSQKVGA